MSGSTKNYGLFRQDDKFVASIRDANNVYTWYNDPPEARGPLTGINNQRVHNDERKHSILNQGLGRTILEKNKALMQVAANRNSQTGTPQIASQYPENPKSKSFGTLVGEGLDKLTGREPFADALNPSVGTEPFIPSHNMEYLIIGGLGLVILILLFK